MKTNQNTRHANNNGIYLLIALGILALFLSSCERIKLDHYRVRMLERNTIAPLTVEYPNVYKVGDTIWLNTSTNRVDNASDSTMLAVIERQIN